MKNAQKNKCFLVNAFKLVLISVNWVKQIIIVCIRNPLRWVHECENMENVKYNSWQLILTLKQHSGPDEHIPLHFKTLSLTPSNYYWPKKVIVHKLTHSLSPNISNWLFLFVVI